MYDTTTRDPLKGDHRTMDDRLSEPAEWGRGSLALSALPRPCDLKLEDLRAQLARSAM